LPGHPAWHSDALPAVALCRSCFNYGARGRIGSLGGHVFSGPVPHTQNLGKPV
jgi:hypothetical protein